METSIVFPLPPTLNEQIKIARTHWAKSAKTKKDWTNSIAFMSRDLPRFEGKVWVEFTWYLRSFKRDPDNVSAAAKYILDGLVEAGTIKDDSLLIIQTPILHRYVLSEKDEVKISISAHDFMSSK